MLYFSSSRLNPTRSVQVGVEKNMSSFSLSNKYYLQYQKLDCYQVHCMAPWGSSVLGLRIYQSWTKASRVGESTLDQQTRKSLTHDLWWLSDSRNSYCSLGLNVGSLTLTVERPLGERVAYLTLPSWSFPSSYPSWRKLSWFESMLALQLHTANPLACGTTSSFRITATELSAFSLEFLSPVLSWRWGNRNLGIITLHVW